MKEERLGKSKHAWEMFDDERVYGVKEDEGTVFWWRESGERGREKRMEKERKKNEVW